MIDRIRVEPGHEPRIAERNPRDTVGLEDEADTKDRLVRLHRRLERLHARLFAEGRRSVLLVIQGMDASGKDGVIRAVMQGVNPQGCRVVSFKAPAGPAGEAGIEQRADQARLPRMELSGALLNPRLQVELAGLRERLSRREAVPRISGRVLRRRQGSVLAAAESVIEQAARPLRVREVHAAVEESLGARVPFSSVNEALSTLAGLDQRFHRLRYGVYEKRA